MPLPGSAQCKWCAQGECWTHAGGSASMQQQQFAPMAAMASMMAFMNGMNSMQQWGGEHDDTQTSGSDSCSWCAKGQCWTHGQVPKKEKAEVKGPVFATTGFSAVNKRIAFRGDSLIMTRTDGAKKSKFKTFKTEVEYAFRETVDYSPSPDCTVASITRSIVTGLDFEILCVGIGCNDLMDRKTEKPLPTYPPRLDDDLRALANVMQKAETSLILLAGDASIWKYPSFWDAHMARMYKVLVDAGATVVPLDEGSSVMRLMPLSSDEMHFLEDEDSKQRFSDAWVRWLNEIAGVEYAPPPDPKKDAEQRARSRSRSRARRKSLFA